MPAGGVGFKGVRCEEPTGRANARPMTGSATKQPSLPVQSLDCFVPPAMENGGGVGYAMNMRAAEAMVSSAPKPMKILPIREV